MSNGDGRPRCHAPATDSLRTIFNADILSGFSPELVSGATLPIGIADMGNDPNMGQSGQYSTTWFKADGIHPGPTTGNVLLGTYFAPAFMRAMGQGYTPICSTVDVTNNVGHWGLTFNAGEGRNARAWSTVTAGLTQSVPLWWISPKYKIVSTEMRTTTAFSGTATLTATLGDSVGGGTISSQSSPYNLPNSRGQHKFPGLHAEHECHPSREQLRPVAHIDRSKPHEYQRRSGAGDLLCCFRAIGAR